MSCANHAQSGAGYCASAAVRHSPEAGSRPTWAAWPPRWLQRSPSKASKPSSVPARTVRFGTGAPNLHWSPSDMMAPKRAWYASQGSEIQKLGNGGLPGSAGFPSTVRPPHVETPVARSTVRRKSSVPRSHCRRARPRSSGRPKSQRRLRRGGGPPGRWRARETVQHGKPATSAKTLAPEQASRSASKRP
eukprot:10467061-Lingulodinium_polyedra.AAC.1